MIEDPLRNRRFCDERELDWDLGPAAPN